MTDKNAICRVLLLLSTMALGCEKSVADAENSQNQENLEQIPTDLMRVEDTESETAAARDRVNLVPEIQNRVHEFITRRSNPIAASVLVDVRSGKILSITQGQLPDEWGGKAHTALHDGFPGASLFKTTVAAAAIEIAGLKPDDTIGFRGGCAHVDSRGYWTLRNENDRSGMTFKRAYGASCNGFFAKLAINRVGLGAISEMARRLGWNGHPIKSDFAMPSSPIQVPNPRSSSVHTVGKFAAGFGYVGLSAVHASWQMLAIARDGEAIPLRFFSKDPAPSQPLRVMKVETAREIRELMQATLKGGTATSAFRHRRYRKIRFDVGGKTGTLTGYAPKGLVTWFSGMMPLDNPEVVVATVVVLDDLWHFKASDLAAETLLAYQDYVDARKKATAVSSEFHH
jgi:cell division protein FtsI/penicillin-binding protein 2